MEDPRKILGPISIIYRSYLACMAKELEAYRIGSGQVDFLMVLYRKDGISQDTIAKILKVSKATSTRAIKNLEKEGYVYREKDETDLRAYRVYLTERGKEVRNVILAKSVYFVDNLLSDLTHEEKEVFSQLVQKTSQKFRESELRPSVLLQNI